MKAALYILAALVLVGAVSVMTPGVAGGFASCDRTSTTCIEDCTRKACENRPPDVSLVRCMNEQQAACTSCCHPGEQAAAAEPNEGAPDPSPKGVTPCHVRCDMEERACRKGGKPEKACREQRDACVEECRKSGYRGSSSPGNADVGEPKGNPVEGALVYECDGQVTCRTGPNESKTCTLTETVNAASESDALTKASANMKSTCARRTKAPEDSCSVDSCRCQATVK